MPSVRHRLDSPPKERLRRAAQSRLAPAHGLSPETVKVETLREIGPRWLTSRIDLDEKTEQRHRSALERIYAWGGDRDPFSLTFSDCQEYVGTLVEGIEDFRPDQAQLAQEVHGHAEDAARLRRRRSQPRPRQARQAADRRGAGARALSMTRTRRSRPGLRSSRRSLLRSTLTFSSSTARSTGHMTGI